MKHFKITESKEFRGLPKSIATTTGQIVTPMILSFNKGSKDRAPQRGQQPNPNIIYVSILSRVYIDQASCDDTCAKEESLRDIKDQIDILVGEYDVFIKEAEALREAGKREEAEVKIAAARKKKEEGLALEPKIREIVGTIDRNSYYEHSTELQLDSLDELIAIESDVTAAVKDSTEFKGLKTVDL